MSLFILSVALVAMCVFLLSFNIIFRKNGQFPDKEVGHNKNMRKLGLMCAKSEERILWGKRGTLRNGFRYDPQRGVPRKNLLSLPPL